MGWIPDWKPQLYRPEQVQVGACGGCMGLYGAPWGYTALQGRMGAAHFRSLHWSQASCRLAPTSVTAISVMGKNW